MEEKNIHTRKPRLVGSIISDMLQGWHRNTELSVNLKTILYSDLRMKTGKNYVGMLRCDQEASIEEYRSRDAHFTFVETLPWISKRNPRVFDGEFISVTRRIDGSLRPNFKPLKVGKDFCVDSYALAVADELRYALKDLIEK